MWWYLATCHTKSLQIVFDLKLACKTPRMFSLLAFQIRLYIRSLDDTLRRLARRVYDRAAQLTHNPVIACLREYRPWPDDSWKPHRLLARWSDPPSSSTPGFIKIQCREINQLSGRSPNWDLGHRTGRVFSQPPVWSAALPGAVMKEYTLPSFRTATIRQATLHHFYTTSVKEN